MKFRPFSQAFSRSTLLSVDMASQQTYVSRVTHHASRLLFAALFVYSLSSAPLSSQPIEGSNFKAAPDFFDPPNEKQMRSLIQGVRWRHEGSQTAVYDVKVQRFQTNGAVELIIEAPECFYDDTKKAVDSP